ncbi:MAG: hypothetical protein V3R39_03600 [Nitrosopumilus sp.]
MVIGYIIPIALVAILGITGYLVYRFLLNDFLCNRSVNATLREFNIKKTQYQIIKEYHVFKGKEISDKEISFLQKRYRQREPDQFLTMYDSIRDKSDTEKK